MPDPLLLSHDKCPLVLNVFVLGVGATGTVVAGGAIATKVSNGLVEGGA